MTKEEASELILQSPKRCTRCEGFGVTDMQAWSGLARLCKDCFGAGVTYPEGWAVALGLLDIPFRRPMTVLAAGMYRDGKLVR
jgi:hypothetical protein